MLRLSIRDLRFRQSRFLISGIATAIVLSVVLVMAGFTAQFYVEAERTVAGFGADGWLYLAGPGGPFTRPSTIPADLAASLRTKGATAVAPMSVLGHNVKIGRSNRIAYIVGIEPGALGSPKIIEGKPLAGRGEMVASRESRLRLGDEVTIGPKVFGIVGLTDRMTLLGGSALLFMLLTDSQDLFYSSQPLARSILLRGEVEVPEGYKVMSRSQISDDALESVATLIATGRSIGLLLWFAATVLQGAVLYIASLERLREFAVMKALGCSNLRLWGGIVTQSLFLALTAACGAAALAFLVLPHLPIPVVIPRIAFAQIGVLAVIAGLAASIGAVHRAAMVDPAIAFATTAG
jgi:ABC-type lipoprotein release transport system permease subunit